MSDKPDGARGKCTEPGCTFADDGRCMEGFANPLECPHFAADSEANPSAGSTPGEAPDPTPRAAVDWVRFPAGEDLTVTDASAITRRLLARVVVVAGEAESGKTTLLASVYDRFQQGPCGEYSFHASQTLPGFERRCHLARLASGRHTPGMERTKLPVRFLHLSVARTDIPSFPQELLLADLSAEVCEQIRDSTEACQSHNFLRRADHLCALVDGEKLRDPTQRGGAVAAAGSIVRSVMDAGMLSSSAHVHFVTTKWDIVHRDDATEEFLAETERTLKTRFGSRVRQLRCWRVAAPARKLEESGACHALSDLLSHWATDTERPSWPRWCGRNTESDREFDKYLDRYFAAVERGSS